MNWKIALVMIALVPLPGALALAGCGGDECTRADDHYDECAATTTSNEDDGTATAEPPAQDCSGTRLCQSKCINGRTCEEITGNHPEYLSCMSACLSP